MSQRRSLTEGLEETPTPAESVRNFVYGKKGTPAPTVGRTPFSTRIRTDFFTALKTASLQRQLNKTEPNTMADILEEAIEPWLKSNGYIQ